MTETRLGSALLVNYCGCPSSFDSLMPDNGLANLAGSLKRAGWNVKIMDYATVGTIGRLVPQEFRTRLQELLKRWELSRGQPSQVAELAGAFQELMTELGRHAEKVRAEIAAELLADIRANNVSWVGFKLWTGAGQEGAQHLAELLKKERPGLKIFGGGPHVENFGAQVLRGLSQVFDAVALGEGEDAVVQLGEYALGRRRMDEVAGVAYRDAGGKIMETEVHRVANLDTLADPCYSPEIYPGMAGDQKLKLIMLDESRGCPYSCNFCFHPVKSGRDWRVRGAVRVVDVMEKLCAETGSHVFRLAGSNPPPEHRKAIAEELIKRGSKFEYVSFGHTRSKNEDYARLRESGCVSLFFGVESGSQRVLDQAANKRTNIAQVRENLRRAKEAGILTSASLIAPMPFDDDASLKETVELMAETKPAGVSVYLPIVTPGTTWYKEAERFGIKFDGDPYQALMKYQVRFLMPPPLWDPLPYSIGGLSYRELVKKTAWVTEELEKRGVLTGMNDSLLLVARELGIDHGTVRGLNRKLFMTADGGGIQEVAAKFNRKVREERGK